MKHKIASIVVGAVLSALFTADAHANRACCSTDGTCKMVQEREQCGSGEIQGRGVTCADNPCCEEELAQALADLEALQQELDQALADLQTCADNCGPVCGDGICECDEEDNCCEDCGPTCGDGVCECDEDSDTCEEDCEAACGSIFESCPCCPGLECAAGVICVPEQQCIEVGGFCSFGGCCEGLSCVFGFCD